MIALLCALTVESMVASPSLSGTSPAAPAWSPDGRWLAFLWNAEGKRARGLWMAGRSAGEPRELEGREVSAFVWAKDGASIFYVSSGDVFRVPAAGGAPSRLTSGGGEKSEPALSPDGVTLSFLQDGDLWLMPVPGGTPERVTQVAVPPIAVLPLGRYYHRDVEIGPPSWGEHPSYAWSPDGRFIAVHLVDRRGVGKVPFPWYLGEEPILNFLRRGAPGDPNETRTIALLDLAARKLRPLELPDNGSMRVIEFSFSPKGPLLIDRQTDNCVDRVIHRADPASGALREIWRDHGDRRIYNEVASTWAPDGERVLMTGDLDDRYRLHLLKPGEPPRALTQGPYDVDGRGIPTAQGIVYVSSQPRPEERQVWRIAEEGDAPVRLSTQEGTDAPFPSPDGRALALLHSDDRNPPALEILEAGTLRTLTHPPPRFAQERWAAVRYATFPGPDGATLHARILMPPSLQPHQRYPVLFGPLYINTVRNRWPDRTLYGLLPQLLVQRGYLVVQVDMRGSTGYGRGFREKFLMDWGNGDLDDVAAAVAYVKTLAYVDGARIGIFGSSYGGLLAVYSLLRKPGLFAAGVAGAPATEPRWFGSDDVAVARTPQEHPETFARGAIRYASGLRDHLLILHGMADDVVPFKTSVDLAEELIRLGKDFDFVVSPSATHAWDSRPDTAAYLLRKLVDHFDRYLGPGPR